MSNSIYYASQALGYFYATQRVREEYEVSATSSLDQQLANLTSLTQQLSDTWMYPQQPTPPMHYDYTPDSTNLNHMSHLHHHTKPSQLAKVPLLRT